MKWDSILFREQVLLRQNTPYFHESPFILIQITEGIAVSPTKSSDYQWLDKNSKRNKN